MVGLTFLLVEVDKGCLPSLLYCELIVFFLPICASVAFDPGEGHPCQTLFQ